MSKRLILVLALAFLVGMTCAAYAEVQNVKVSGDITVLGIARNMHVEKETQSDSGTNSGIASIARVRVDADLTDNVGATVRLLNERYWGSEDTTHGSSTGVDIDLAYATLKEFLYSPLSVTVGRQELHFGNDMVIGDPDTNNAVTTRSAFSKAGGDFDLTARKAFDAIRMTLNYDPLVIDGVYSRVNETSTSSINKDKTDLYGVNANYKVGDKFGLKNTVVEGYWFLKQAGRKAGVANKKDTVHTIGARMSTQPVTDMTFQLESAYQLGNRLTGVGAENTYQKRNAWALETALSYMFSKVKYTPQATVGYAFFSGQKNGNIGLNKVYRGWDPMYENQKFGDIANALFPQTNAHVAMGQLSAKPMDDLTAKAEYYAFWWDKRYNDGDIITTARGDNNILMRSKRFAGQELDLTLTYDYTEDVQFGLLGGLFFPGSSFNKLGSANHNSYVNSELIGSMKVTF